MMRGDYVYSAKSSGELVCLEAGTGKQVWGNEQRDRTEIRREHPPDAQW